VNNTITGGTYIPSNTFAFNVLLDKGKNLQLNISSTNSNGWIIAFNSAVIDILPGENKPVVIEE
jgi:hypothetical protein